MLAKIIRVQLIVALFMLNFIRSYAQDPMRTISICLYDSSIERGFIRSSDKYKVSLAEPYRQDTFGANADSNWFNNIELGRFQPVVHLPIIIIKLKDNKKDTMVINLITDSSLYKRMDIPITPSGCAGFSLKIPFKKGIFYPEFVWDAKKKFFEISSNYIWKEERKKK